jgi:hypothetical protein
VNPYYDTNHHESGELRLTKAGTDIDVPMNPTGKGVPVFSDDMTRKVGFILPGTPVMVLTRPEATVRGTGRVSPFVEVLAPIGRCWMYAKDIEGT